MVQVSSSLPSLDRTRDTLPAVKLATQRSAPSHSTNRGPAPTVVKAVPSVDVGAHHCLKDARGLPRFSDWSRVRVMNAAICSRGTFALGLYVVGVVPLVSAEKNVSAIEQKNTLLEGTSVKGSVTI